VPYEHVILIQHPSLDTLNNLAVIKYSIAATVETETDIYKRLAGSYVVPKFLGQISENGQLFGFLIECISDPRPANARGLENSETKSACKRATRRPTGTMCATEMRMPGTV
jgi:hypothetical protein